MKINAKNLMFVSIGILALVVASTIFQTRDSAADSPKDNGFPAAEVRKMLEIEEEGFFAWHVSPLGGSVKVYYDRSDGFDEAGEIRKVSDTSFLKLEMDEGAMWVQNKFSVEGYRFLLVK